MDPERSVPDVFADGVSLAGGAYGVTLTFVLTTPSSAGAAPSATPVARVRLAPELARVLGQALAQIRPASASTSAPEPTTGGATR